MTLPSGAATWPRDVCCRACPGLVSSCASRPGDGPSGRSINAMLSESDRVWARREMWPLLHLASKVQRTRARSSSATGWRVHGRDQPEKTTLHSVALLLAFAQASHATADAYPPHSGNLRTNPQVCDRGVGLHHLGQVVDKLALCLSAGGICGSSVRRLHVVDDELATKCSLVSTFELRPWC